MTRRTKIVATLGPASRLAGARSRRCCAPASTSCGSTSATASSTSTSSGSRAVREVAAAVGRPIGVLADLPGPKIRAGGVPRRRRRARARRASCGSSPGTGAEHGGGDLRRLPDPARRRRSRRPRRDRRRRHLAARRRRDDDGDHRAEVETGGRPQGRPGCTCRASGCSCSPRPTTTSCSPRRWPRPASTTSPCRSCGGRPTSTRCAPSSATRRRIVAKIETASALGDLDEITDAADAVMVARGDLGIDCPLEDVPHLQKQIIRHCVEVGVAGHHGHADARVDDRRPVADPGRGQRRRQRGVRRHRRRHALGRDGDRPRPGPGRAHDGAGSPSGPSPRPATGSGPSGWAGAADVGRRRVGPDHGRRDHTPRGRPPTTPRRRRSSAAPAAAARPGRWPGSGPRPAARACHRTRARVDALTLSWGVEPVQVEEYTLDRRDGVVRGRDRARSTA